MKDIKLTIEEIKKIFECFEIEDFEKEIIEDKTIIHMSNRQYPVLVSAIGLRDMEYKLFIQRVIESMNEDIKFRIKQEGNILDVYLCDDFGDVKSIKQIGGDSNDGAKEQAIIYILSKS